MFQVIAQFWGDVFHTYGQRHTLSNIHFGRDLYMLSCSPYSFTFDTFTLPLSDAALVEENTPDMAGIQPPSCPGANNTVWNTNVCDSYVVYCESIFQRYEVLPTIHNTSFSDCFSACEKYTSNPAVGNGAACIAFSWSILDNGVTEYINIWHVSVPTLTQLPNVTSFRRTDYELGANQSTHSAPRQG